jgi:hypothetical protein
MSKLHAAILTVIALGAGVLLGLVIATASSGSLRQLEVENDRLADGNARLTADCHQWAAAYERLESTAAESKRLAGELQTALDNERAVERRGKEFAAWWLQSQAVLKLVIDEPAMVELIRTPRFQRNFHPEWWAPDAGFELLGGRWFAEEMVRHGAADRELLTRIDRQNTP